MVRCIVRTVSVPLGSMFSVLSLFLSEIWKPLLCKNTSPSLPCTDTASSHCSTTGSSTIYLIWFVIFCNTSGVLSCLRNTCYLSYLLFLDAYTTLLLHCCFYSSLIHFIFSLGIKIGWTRPDAFCLAFWRLIHFLSTSSYRWSSFFSFYLVLRCLLAHFYRSAYLLLLWASLDFSLQRFSLNVTHPLTLRTY